MTDEMLEMIAGFTIPGLEGLEDKTRRSIIALFVMTLYAQRGMHADDIATALMMFAIANLGGMDEMVVSRAYRKFFEDVAELAEKSSE